MERKKGMIGHEKIIRDFKKLVGAGNLSHSYLFHGPSMVGKRTMALALARFLEKGEFEAPAANEVLQDAKVIDLALANSIGVDAVREVKNFLWQKPNASAKRTLIIDEAERLTTEAQNALLKITEEPPISSLLIVIASDLESIMPTILSRLQKVYFGMVPEAAIAEWLTDDRAVAKAPAKILAKKALGKPGLALRLQQDDAFKENLALAEKFLKTTPANRRDFIKKLIEPDEFTLRNFLDAVIITLAWEKPGKVKAALWHRVLALRENADNFGLNPRLQLMSLLNVS